MWSIYVVTGFPRCDSEFDFIFLDGSCSYVKEIYTYRRKIRMPCYALISSFLPNHVILNLP